MFDTTRDLQDFYDNHVRLGAELRSALASARDLNLGRLDSGLKEIGEDNHTTYNGPIDTKNQGSYAMHTLNQSDEYDIDVALIFEKSDLPDDPLQARQRIRDALLKKCTNFSQEPEARTNAVTVWYQDGYHIDFAIYRTWEEFNGFSFVTRIEHASTDWNARDPMEVNNWFAKAVEEKSPKPDNLLFSAPPKVALGQMRRVVRFVKKFCRSRTSYCLPGGMVISALIAESYIPDRDRDDVALYQTLQSLKNRLSCSTKVFSPVNSSTELTSKPEFLNEVKRLKKELDKHLPRLAILNDPKCTLDAARNAWDWIFNHEFWHPVSRKFEDQLQKSAGSADKARYLPYFVEISCRLTRGSGGLAYASYKNDGNPLPKGLGLRFSVERTSCTEPYATHWSVENEGDEAEEANQSKWDRYESKCETSTKYRGRQTMTCRLEKSGRVVAEQAFIVNIT